MKKNRILIKQSPRLTLSVEAALYIINEDIINNFNEKSLIEQANLLSAQAIEQSEQSTSNKMGFTILCKLKGV